MQLIELLPSYYMASPETADLQSAMGMAVDAAERARDELMQQLDMSTATWGLSTWERAYGITPDTSMSTERRRSKLMSKMRGQGTTSVAMIKNVAESFVNGIVEVVDIPDEYRFEVKFVNTIGRPPNLDDVAAAIEEIKPAHLLYTFIFLFRTYRLLREYKNSKLSKYTIRNIREEDGIYYGHTITTLQIDQAGAG